jgi:hypothetical protein
LARGDAFTCGCANAAKTFHGFRCAWRGRNAANNQGNGRHCNSAADSDIHFHRRPHAHFYGLVDITPFWILKLGQTLSTSDRIAFETCRTGIALCVRRDGFFK